MKNYVKVLLYIISILFGYCYPTFASSENMEDFRYLDPTHEICRTYTENQIYPKYIAKEGIEIPNGSMINFAAAGLVGKIIRSASAKNDIPNPLGLTHSGIIINENPRWLFSKVLSLMPDESRSKSIKTKLISDKTNPRGIASLSKKVGKSILRELLQHHKDVISMLNDPGIFRPFSMESNGSAKDVFSGMAPHTHIYDLSNRISEYDGNIYFRPLLKAVSCKETRAFMEDFLGRPYESLFSLRELLQATRNLNKTEKTENVFCSELAGCFYKECGLIKGNVSNIIPENFGSEADFGDVLKGIAGRDIPLKKKYEFKRADIKGKGDCGLNIASCCMGID
ncbi:MAG: hypothetical protein LBU35_03630 [Holosporales bacterium]|jgi:hypothetical protein|nr:hypothetical protein [Holosporales bacterium]